MRIGLLQMDIAWEDREANFRKVERHLPEARDRGVELLVLPELFALGFTMNPGPFAEDEEGPTTAFLRRTAREWDLHVLGGAVLRTPGGSKPRNAALLFAPDGTRPARYDKVHPFTLSGEHEHYEAGDAVVVAPVLGFRVQLTICYDLRFPELYRAGLERGADLAVCIASWPSARVAHWKLLARARAVDNLAYVAACNRTGEGGGLAYPGASSIAAPGGEVLAEAGGEETLLIADLDPGRAAEARQKLPFVRDRRPELYRRWGQERAGGRPPESGAPRGGGDVFLQDPG